MMDEEVDWVVIRRFDDGVEAQMTRDFLRDHGLRVAMLGNSGATSVLNRFDTVLDVRLVVPRAELDHAREALAAMTADASSLAEPPDAEAHGPSEGAPYRASRVRDDAPLRHRHRRAAFVLAFAVPIGGGHLYARHHVAGALLACGAVGAFGAGAIAGMPWLTLAALLVVVADAVFAVRAVRRFNDGRVAGPRAQATFAVLAVAAAIAIAALVSG